LLYVNLLNILEKNPMDKDLLNQTDQKWIKSGDLIVDLPSFQNGFQKEEKRYRQEIWDYIQYRESLVRWPLMNEKIKMGISLNNG
jgi:GTP-binding protein EngB required for normal cell division